MKKETKSLALTEKEMNLRLGLVGLIRGHVEERNISKESLAKVLDSLQFVFGDLRFTETEINETDLSRDEHQEFYGAVFRIDKDLLGEM